MNESHMLSILLAVPFAGALLCGLVLPQKRAAELKAVAIITALLSFCIALGLFAEFEPRAGYQFVEKYDWIPSYGISFRIGLDGLNLFMVLATALLTTVALTASWHRIDEHNVKAMTGLVLFLEGSLLGAYISLDVFLFYVFYEAMLIPIVLLMFFYGGPNRSAATLKFLIYTVAASLLMLVALLVMYMQHYAQFGYYSAYITSLAEVSLPGNLALFVFPALMIAFAVKSPVFPFHSWMPDAYAEAPPIGSILLAGLMGKVGIYGFFRIALPLFPAEAMAIAPWMALLAVVAVTYGALIATVQQDLKRLAAFLSFSHVGTIVLGIFVANLQGFHGAVIQMANHALIVAAIFILIGILEDRRSGRNIADFGGIAAQVPGIATVMMIIMLAAIGLPGLNGFVGEALILMGAFKHKVVIGALATTGMVTGAVCMLWMYERVFFGTAKDAVKAITLPDLKKHEWVALIALLIPIVWIGVSPGTLLKKVEPDLQQHVMMLDRSSRGDYVQAGNSRPEDGTQRRIAHTAAQALKRNFIED